MQSQIPPHDASSTGEDALRGSTGIPRDVLETVREVSRRYQITALDDFVASCRSFAEEEVLNIAILGRFKTGKSSFLNKLLGRTVLPVGVIPVTAVVIEIQYGPAERAEIRFLDGSTHVVAIEHVDEFVAEEKNPANRKGVAIVRIEIPSMEHYRGIRFVDTPGLESVFQHNTAASIEWLPNVGLALVAVGADVPLSQHDIEFIRNLGRFTPNISILLTKVDILDAAQQAQVIRFVEDQIEKHLNRSLTIYPYSTRPGFEALREKLDEALLLKTQQGAKREREAILRQKLV